MMSYREHIEKLVEAQEINLRRLKKLYEDPLLGYERHQKVRGELKKVTKMIKDLHKTLEEC